MKDILYISIDLDEQSRLKLKSFAEQYVRDVYGDDAIFICHHCTVAFRNKLNDEVLSWCDAHNHESFYMYVDRIGFSDKACAVSVDFGNDVIPCQQAYPHITVAVNSANKGKPVDSNFITDFEDVYQNIKLCGELTYHYRGEINDTVLRESELRPCISDMLIESIDDYDDITAYLADYKPQELNFDNITSTELAEWCSSAGDFLYIYEFPIGGWKARAANTSEIVSDIVSDIQSCGYIEHTHEADQYIINRPKEFEGFYVAVYKICDIPGEKDYYIVYQEER